MKRTRWKHIFRNIAENLNRFLSILFIVALGAGFMAGLAAASPDMYDSADRYIDECRLFDIHIKSPIGFDEDTFSSLNSLDCVEALQGGTVLDMILVQEHGSDFTSRVYGILDDHSETRLNRIVLKEGRLPEDPSECVVESAIGRYSGQQVQVGDVLTLSEETAGFSALRSNMTETSLRVVGICQSPMCLSIEGDATNIGSGTINLNVYVQRSFFTTPEDTDLFLTVTDASSFNAFSEDYDVRIRSALEEIRPVGERLLQARSGRLREELAEQFRNVSSLQEVVQVQQAMQEDLSFRVDQTRETMELLPTGSSLRELLQDISSRAEDVLSGAPSLSDTVSSLQASQELLEESTWIYRTREDLAGFDSYHQNVGKVSALARIFPVFFFIVALLVALTTMTRLVEENRLQIGTLKALGYTDGQILLEYLLFSLSASVFGCIVGFGAGFYIFPAAINSAYSMMYTLPPMDTPIRWDIVAWVAPVTIVSILLAALWSCWNEFRSMPARLMQPKAPSPGKRIWLEHITVLWNRISFTYKVTLRNLFRYKKRFVMTVIGVAGCSALLLTGFGIRDSVNDIVDKQFGEIYRYDMIFYGSDDQFTEKDSALQSLLDDPTLVASWLQVCQSAGKLSTETGSQEITLMVPKDLEALPEFVVLRSRSSGQEYSLTSDGIILTEKICEELGIREGDSVTLEDPDGHRAMARVSAITENYVSSFAYLTEAYYRELFSSAPSFTGLLCKSAEGADPTSDIMACPSILYGASAKNLKNSFSESINSINGVILVLILAAGLLCMVVLYNLINVNICERRKEIATLKVLGFYPKEAQNYIFRETNLLSLLGGLAGLLIGIWLHGYVVRTVEVNHIMFGRDISPFSFVIALGITMCFTFLVNLFMRRPINHTDMVEAMKAND